MNAMQLRNNVSITVHNKVLPPEYERHIVPGSTLSKWEHVLFTPHQTTTQPTSASVAGLSPWEKELLRQSRQTRELLDTLASPFGLE